MFPFVLPWEDASPGVTDLSGWSPRPAGDAGPVRAAADGHLYAGNRRIRFLGVNVCFAACFPAREDADKIAARMARFGINVVRFHHMDMSPFREIWRKNGQSCTPGPRPARLLRRTLQRGGIYASRTCSSPSFGRRTAWRVERRLEGRHPRLLPEPVEELQPFAVSCWAIAIRTRNGLWRRPGRSLRRINNGIASPPAWRPESLPALARPPQ
jgi:hypothetical protein